MPKRVCLLLRLSCFLIIAMPGSLGPASSCSAQTPGTVAKSDEVESGGVASVASATPPPGESFFRLMIRASGMIGVVILVMSFYLTALVVWMSFEYRRKVVAPPGLVSEIKSLLDQRKFTEAFQRISTDRSFLAKVLSAGVRKLPSGMPTAQRAMEMANDESTMAMDHRTTYLATVGTLGPMIGLVGTVYGMIESFRVIAVAGASPQASQLAGGISTALFATLEGIAISIPAIYFHAMFRNRIARLSLDVAIQSESLLELFAPGVRTPHPLAAAAQRSIGGPGSI
ncbi:MAG: MotA/TolQ/ExbB proton channel family protein [Isosphaeraceae bacterium]|nr:MotA/TolQ/ExbB proton channel family protein [Isosphaeraceae bacterium]